MQATPPDIDQAPGESASQPTAAIPALVVCLRSDAACAAGDLARWNTLLPAAHVVPIGAASQGGPLADLDPQSPLVEVVAAAARAFPGADLLVGDAGAALPEFACERLLRAIAEPGVLGAFPMDDGARNPLPPGAAPTPASLDAICFAFSARQLLPQAGFPPPPAALSAWRGSALAAAGAASGLDFDRIADAGMQLVVLDHLYVPLGRDRPGTPGAADTRDLPPPSVLEPLRARIDAALGNGNAPCRCGLDGLPVILHVLHGWGGGAERWVHDLAATDPSAHHLVLVSRGSFGRKRHGEWLELHDGRMPDAPLRRWPLPQPIADTALANPAYRMLLDGIIRDWSVDAIIVSSLIGHSLDVLRSGVRTCLVVHDHYPLWPVLHRDFGDPALAFDNAQLAADLDSLGPDAEFANRDHAHWQRLRDATVAALIGAGASIVAPSRSALANHLRLAPELGVLSTTVIAHGLPPWREHVPVVAPPPRRSRLRLVMTGRIRKGKGAELLRAALPGLLHHAEVFLLGAGKDAQALFGTAGVHVLFDYPREALPGLLAALRPDAALLLPTVAETFSYTLSELRSLGLPVIATRVGALAERIADGEDGFLVDPDPAEVVARVASLGAGSDLDRVRQRLLAAPSGASAETMARRWSQFLALPQRAPLRYPIASIDASMLERMADATALRRAAGREATLSSTLRAARAENARRGEWGHALDRELRNAAERIRHAGAQLDAVHRELDERTRWAQQLNAELQDIRPRHERMQASLSWRLTAPLRSGKARVKRVQASLAFRGHRLVSTLARVRGSIARRGFAATLARAAEEFRAGGKAPHLAALRQPVDDPRPFALPGSDSPRISIIIPVYNKIAYTLACLRSLAEHAGTTPFEVIVVDDGSTDATQERLAAVGGIRSVRNASNLGFVGSCNAGAATARGEFVLFLNNDTVVTPGWLEALLRCAEKAPDAGLVGARLVYPDGRLQEAGGIVFSDGSGWNYGRFEDPSDPRYGFRREVDYCSGAAILLRRDLFERLGAFDTRYSPAYYEDTDLAFAVRAAGLKVYYEPAATVIHFEGITSGTDTASGTKRYQVVNREKFLEKWKDALARQPAPDTPITVAATHRATRRVLIVDATTPTPDQDSGSVRIVNVMRVLGDLGCQVSFLPENRAWIEGYTADLQALGIEALYAPYAQDPVRILRERGHEFDLVILCRHYVAASFIGLLRLHAPQARIAFDTVDLHYLREQRAAELEGSAELARVAASTRTQELKVIRDCDVTLVVSPVEKELLATDAPDARVEVLSNVHEIHGCRNGFADRHGLVFVGGFQHPPNVDAVQWFVAEVFPLVRASLPGIEFHVIGSKVPESIRALGGDGITVHGFVPDIMPYMDGCRVSVAPLRYGAGVKGKVNMAMSCGLPVVATPMAIEGMHVESGREVLVAADAAAFAADVVRLHGDQALWETLSAQGLANVERHFSFAAARQALAGLLDNGRVPAA